MRSGASDTFFRMRGTDDRHEYLAEKSRAFEALAALINSTINPAGNLVVLAESRSKGVLS